MQWTHTCPVHCTYVNLMCFPSCLASTAFCAFTYCVCCNGWSGKQANTKWPQIYTCIHIRARDRKGIAAFKTTDNHTQRNLPCGTVTSCPTWLNSQLWCPRRYMNWSSHGRPGSTAWSSFWSLHTTTIPGRGQIDTERQLIWEYIQYGWRCIASVRTSP